MKSAVKRQTVNYTSERSSRRKPGSYNYNQEDPGLRRGDDGDINDRLSNILKFSNELSNSRLRETKARWTPEKRAEKAALAQIHCPWAHSTGPKTPEGRAKTSQNARKHPDFRLYNHFLSAQSCWRRLVLLRADIKTWQADGKPVLEDRLAGLEKLIKRYQKTLEMAGVETLDQLLKKVREKLAQNGVENPALDARILVREGGQFSDENMLSGGSTPLSAEVIDRVEKFVSQRIAGGPVSRIIGRREFWGLDFALSKDTLDPRPDTEILVEKALSFARDFTLHNAAHRLDALPSKEDDDDGAKKTRILDLGTGTGCILISLLSELPDATGVGVDLNPGAVDVARANAQALGVAESAQFRQGSWFEPLAAGELFDLIVSNPPYIPESDIPNLAKEVRNHDPILALAGGLDGLDPYRLLFANAKKYLNCGGRALFEIGAGQLPDIVRLVDDSNATLVSVTPDLAGIPRVVELSWG